GFLLNGHLCNAWFFMVLLYFERHSARLLASKTSVTMVLSKVNRSFVCPFLSNSKRFTTYRITSFLATSRSLPFTTIQGDLTVPVFLNMASLYFVNSSHLDWASTSTLLSFHCFSGL